MNTLGNSFSPLCTLAQDSANSPESRPCSDFSLLADRKMQYPSENSGQTLVCQNEPTSSVLESSDFAVVRPLNRVGDRVSTVLLTSESVISRNKLQECSVHIEKLCEHSNSIAHSRKFEDKIQINQIPELYVPVFTTHPTIAFCSKCGRDVKTKIIRPEKRVFGLRVDNFFCCLNAFPCQQELKHVCSRCKAELVKITL
jgi:hypothetical protein